MPTVFEKLNLKEQREIVVAHAPPEFDPVVSALAGVTVCRDVRKAKTIAFCLVFVTCQQDLEAIAPAIVAKAAGDAVVWFAYPKGSSKKYKSDLTRDKGWAVVKDAGFDTVRQVAIDDDWSALRFRRVEFIGR